MDLNSFDVLVVGAGPTGFTLAIDLGQRGVRTLLVERDPSTKQFPKMDRSNARTMEIFRRLGIADRVREQGYPPEASMDVLVVTRLSDPPLATLTYPTVAQHRRMIAAATDSSEPLEPYQLVSQNDLEPLLLDVAKNTPNVVVRFGAELVSFEQTEEQVTATLRGTDGGEETVAVSYLVGCDGGQSTVRKTLGIPLEGHGSIAQLKQIAIESDALYDRIPIGKARHYYFADPQGSAIVVQGSRRHFTLNSVLPDDADVEQEVRDRIGFDVPFEVTNVTPWKFHLLLAERYRDGRVFIAGDAAHLVIPTGGLGMNTGVGDAIDLSWKLAGTVRGWGGPGLLDGYEAERRRVGRRNVNAAGWAADGMSRWRVFTTDDTYAESPEGEAVRDIVGAAAAIHQRRVHEMIGVELDYSYAGSGLIASTSPEDAEWATTVYSGRCRPGVRLPHLWLADGRSSLDAVGPDFTVLVLRTDAETGTLSAALTEAGAPFEVVTLDDEHAARTYGCSVLLIRPDLHVVWCGDVAPDAAAATDLVARAVGRTGGVPEGAGGR
ncbi:FAD-dependent monooxygenase [Nocardioides humi]|uniref:FAD-dependent oxidoreductase n=1 Tax=Nocardioides humi TaxID=449461 RepID=A0ABN2BRH8_9ACTN|nr:FAD-dependent monooxygenase [Nocardioides humi]